MSKIQIFIDGKSVIAESGQTILQACRAQGIEIPTLCHDDQLEPFTSCFLCVVEVEGARTFVPSCATKVNQGMNITTSSPAIQSARKMALELILSNHYADCLGPCKLNCPAGVDVQGYLALAAMGKYREAIQLIKENNPLPTVCGRVCTRPCEMNCRRNLVDQPAAIDHVKRFIADFDLDSDDRFFPDLKPETGRRVAIVGAGPAGLSSAYYLRIQGHHVDIFDAKPRAGGMLRWGIPQYRLPENILDKEIEGVTRLGVDIHLNKALGRDFTIDSLFDNGYEAVFLGLGAQASTNMRVENENSPGVLSGIDLLEDVKLGKVSSLSGRVAVIGGGNTAMDAARSALRLGADEVTVIYRRTRTEMPANAMEIEEAEEEGVKFTFLTAPTKVVLNEQGKLRGLECVKMELGEPDASGRRRPVPIDNSAHIIELDLVIAAIGQKPDFEFAGKDDRLVEIRKTRWGTLEIHPEEMKTNIPGVYAGGDVVLGPATAVEAVADGHKAALAIHEYLTSEKLRPVKKPFLSRRDNFKQLSSDDFQHVPKTVRQKMPVRHPDDRKKNWEEIELGFSGEQVYQEAIRCLECGCQAFYDCDLQKHSTEYEAVQTSYKGEFQDSKPDKSHPYFQVDLNKCILCGRCVRICDEVMGLGVFGFVQRGFEAHIKPTLEMPLAETLCISCGQCVESCPTGAITDKVDAEKPGPWILEQQKTLCQFCSVGCTMQADILENRVLKISADKGADVNEFGNLCVKGRYGFSYLNDSGRLKAPMIRRDGELVTVSWEEAFDFAAGRIGALNNRKLQWAVYGSPHVTNEENYLLQKFSRTVLQSNNVGSFANLTELPEAVLRAAMSNTTFQRISESDFIMVFDFDPMDTHPVVYIKLQKAARKGSTVVVVKEEETRLGRKGKMLPVPSEQKVSFLKYLIDSIYQSRYSKKLNPGLPASELKDIISEVAGYSQKMRPEDLNLTKSEFNTFLKNLVTSKTPLLVINRSKEDLQSIHWLNTLMTVLGQAEAFISLPSGANFQGMLDMGLLPGFLPGYQSVAEEKIRVRFSKSWGQNLPDRKGLTAMESLRRINQGDIQGMIFWGQDPVGTSGLKLRRSGDSFMMVADMFLTGTAREADVVFPLLPFAESHGTVTNAEMRIRQFEPAIGPASEYENWAILRELFIRLGTPAGYKTASDVSREIIENVPEYCDGRAIFRNGYTPQPLPAKEDEPTAAPYGASYLDRWFDEFAKKSEKKQIQGNPSFYLQNNGRHS